MSVELRAAESDVDLEAWRQVRIAVLPNERAASVEEMRASATPETLWLLAELDGELAGSGIAGRSDLPGLGFVAPRVLPQTRRRGVGSALLTALGQHVSSLGFPEVSALVEEDGALAFAQRFGFREVDRDVEQVRIVGDEPRPRIPEGVEIVTVADRPELWRAAYDPLALQAFMDMALDRPVETPLEQWESEWINWPDATFIALADEEVIGCAGLMQDADRPERAENALTAVRRDWRGRGVAAALKRSALAFAAANRIHEVYTWTQTGNEDMRRLNERLGYDYRAVCIRARAPLPLP